MLAVAVRRSIGKESYARDLIDAGFFPRQVAARYAQTMRCDLSVEVAVCCRVIPCP